MMGWVKCLSGLLSLALMGGSVSMWMALGPGQFHLMVAAFATGLALMIITAKSIERENV